MIKVKFLLHVQTGLEREVFAHCGALLQGRLQQEVEGAFRCLAGDYRQGVGIHVSMNLGTIRRINWRTDLCARVLSALKTQAFKVHVVDGCVGTLPDDAAMRPTRCGEDAAADLGGAQSPTDAMSAFAHFLAHGHFRGMPPWRDRSPATWLATQLVQQERDVSRVLSGLVEDTVAYTRLQRAVGVSLAFRTREVCRNDSVIAWILAALAGRALEGTAPWGSNAPIDWIEYQLRQSQSRLGDVLLSIWDDSPGKMRLTKLVGAEGVSRISRVLDDRKRSALLPMPESGAVRASASASRAPRGRTAGAPPAENGPLPLVNAGLLCLWPLIPALLAAINAVPLAHNDAAAMAANGDIASSATVVDSDEAGDHHASESAVQRAQSAAMALDYLVWGESEWQEWRMPLNKVLCGLPLDAVIDAPSLANWRLEKIDAWLQALPSRLPGLRHCGVSDLRAFYLQRPGRLLTEGGRWCVEVDDDASDILLDGLPWPIQQALLPWLSDPIAIKWR